MYEYIGVEFATILGDFLDQKAMLECIGVKFVNRMKALANVI